MPNERGGRRSAGARGRVARWQALVELRKELTLSFSLSLWAESLSLALARAFKMLGQLKDGAVHLPKRIPGIPRIRHRWQPKCKRGSRTLEKATRLLMSTCVGGLESKKVEFTAMPRPVPGSGAEPSAGFCRDAVGGSPTFL